jgi:uncharacterized damage-inducible protein DinB
MTVASLYEGWHRVQNHLVHRLPRLGNDELALRASDDSWPIWAIVSHLAGGRVYWLCTQFKEPGIETTPFTDAADGWEDHLDVPRRADELLFAIESSGRIVESCFERWTPETLGVSITRETASGTQYHTRSSVLTRIVMHDSFHCGEISQLLGSRGLRSMDPWDPVG